PACTVTGVDAGAPVLSPPTGTEVHTLPGTATTTSFAGLSPNTSYHFTVYAHNGQGCTASATVTATPRAAPGTVTSIETTGAIPSGTGTWDFQLSSLTIASGSADVDGFQYRLAGGTTSGAEYSGQPGVGFLTADGTQYGQSVTVQVKACKQHPEVRLCSLEWSTPFALGRPVSIQLSGLQAIETLAPDPGVTPGEGLWSWTGEPVAHGGGSAGYDGVEIACGAGAVPAGSLQCAVVGGGPLGDAYPSLTVTVTANGEVYARTYNWAETPH